MQAFWETGKGASARPQREVMVGDRGLSWSLTGSGCQITEFQASRAYAPARLLVLTTIGQNPVTRVNTSHITR
jgi:hypothetical protein